MLETMVLILALISEDPSDKTADLHYVYFNSMDYQCEDDRLWLLGVDERSEILGVVTCFEYGKFKEVP